MKVAAGFDNLPTTRVVVVFFVVDNKGEWGEIKVLDYLSKIYA